MRRHIGRHALALILLLTLAHGPADASRPAAEAEGTPLTIVPLASSHAPAIKAAKPVQKSEPASKAVAATPAAGQAKQKKTAAQGKAKPSAIPAEPAVLKAPPQNAKDRTGPYIATEPTTGATVLGVSRPEPSGDAAGIAPIIVVPEIDVPAQQPQGQAQTYRPGAEQQPPNVYRPGGQ